MEERYPLGQVAAWLDVDPATLYRWRVRADILKETNDGMTRAQIVRVATNHNRALPRDFFSDSPAAPALSLSDTLLPWEDDDTKQRLTAAEAEIAALKEEVQRLKEARQRPAPRRPAEEPTAASEHKAYYNEPTESDMPPELVGWRLFCWHLHGIPESTVHKAIHGKRPHIPIVPGSWTVGKAPVREALDAQGRAIFYRRYHLHPKFKRCPQCPHGAAED